MNTITTDTWTPELWNNFVSAVYANRDQITEDLVRQFLSDHGIIYDEVAAEVKAMTNAEFCTLISG